MRTEWVIADVEIDRGRFVSPGENGTYRPDPTLKAKGGVARKPYTEWPPLPIQPGERFEIMTDGKILGLIGSKPFGLNLSDGSIRFDLIPLHQRGEFRYAMLKSGYPLD